MPHVDGASQHNALDLNMKWNRWQTPPQVFLLTSLLLPLTGIPASAADVMNCELFKRQVYYQTNSGSPAPFRHIPFSAGAVVNLVTSNSATSASVTLPSGLLVDLGLNFEEHFLPAHWQFIEMASFWDKISLDSEWGNGGYQFSIATAHDGLRSVTFTLAGDTYPNEPHIQNYIEAQTIDSAQEFVLKWDAFVGGTTNDFILALITEQNSLKTAFCTPLPHDPNHLDGTARQVAIPAGRLEPYRTYSCEVWFAKVTSRDTTSYPGVLAGAAYVKATAFAIGTQFPCEAPIIAEQPQPQTIHEGCINDDGNWAYFRVTAMGAGPLSYQWRKNGILIPTGIGDNLTITTAQLADGGNYDVIVANTCGSVTSQVATLTVVAAPPNFTLPGSSQPASQSVEPGATVWLNGYTKCACPITFQWRKNGVSMPGRTNNYLVIANAQIADAGNYDLIETNPYGSATSHVATLTVTNQPPPPVTLPPGLLSQPTPPGLVAWWTGDGTPNDRCGSYHANPINGVSYATGIVGKCFSFNGVNAFLNVSNAPGLNFHDRTPMTIELWAYRTGSAQGQNIIGKRIGCGGAGIQYQMSFSSYNSEGLVFGANLPFVQTHIELPMNQWMHLAGTFDGTTLRFYTNGVLAAREDAGLGPDNNGPLRIGQVGDCVGFGGLLDEIAIYNRALSPSEIRSIHAAGSAGKCKAPAFAGIKRDWNGNVQLDLRGETGKNITIAYSIDLSNWSLLAILPNAFGTNRFIDAANPELPRKFYRLSQ